MNIRKTVSILGVILVAVLLICMFKACGAGNDEIKWSLTEEDYNNKKETVSVVAVSNDTVKAVKEFVREAAESVVPKNYTLCDYFTVYESGGIFEKSTFECWILVEDASENKGVIIIGMPDVEDVEQVREFIYSNKNQVPKLEVCIAPPAEENVHYYMRIT